MTRWWWNWNHVIQHCERICIKIKMPCNSMFCYFNSMQWKVHSFCVGVNNGGCSVEHNQIVFHCILQSDCETRNWTSRSKHKFCFAVEKISNEKVERIKLLWHKQSQAHHNSDNRLTIPKSGGLSTLFVRWYCSLLAYKELLNG